MKYGITVQLRGEKACKEIRYNDSGSARLEFSLVRDNAAIVESARLFARTDTGEKITLESIRH